MNRVTERRPYARTGLNALKARVKVKGLAAIDRRTAGARELLEWRGQLISDLGGAEVLTAARLALVEAATRTWLYLGSVDAYLLEQRSLVNLRRRSLLPVVRERQQLVDSLVRILQTLGLERRARKIPDLNEYLQSKYAGPVANSAVDSQSEARSQVPATPGDPHPLCPSLARPAGASGGEESNTPPSPSPLGGEQ